MDCQKITLIQNGIDCSIFRPSDSLKAKNHLNLQAEERIILSIGSLNKTKNHSLLINTFAETAALNNTWRLYIIGEGVERKCLEKQILDLGLNKKVILLGLQNHSSLPQWLNAADIFVLPSQSEGTPNALLEAMACGLPVIASNVGGIPELIQDNIEGLLFESGSKDDLKEKLNRLIQDKGLQKTLAENAGKKITSQYGSWKTQAEKLLSLYEQLLSSRTN
jgi:glycosyltransferase involved in cell wall biosynthesis